MFSFHHLFHFLGCFSFSLSKVDDVLMFLPCCCNACLLQSWKIMSYIFFPSYKLHFEQMRIHIFFPGYNFTFYILTSWRLHISTSKLQFLIFEELQVTYLDFKVTSYDFFMKSYDFLMKSYDLFRPLGGGTGTPKLLFWDPCLKVPTVYLKVSSV